MLSTSLRCCLAVLTATTWYAASASSVSAQSAALSNKATNLETILDKVRGDGRARVIVKFSVPEVNTTTEAGAARHGANVRAAQDAIISSALDAGTAVSRMRVVPMFATMVNRGQLERLAADPRVVKIYPNQVNTPHLNDSVDLVRATGLRKNGGNGSGQIVAVIDTGVKRNHEFLKNKVLLGACFVNNGGVGTVPGSTCPDGTYEQVGPDAGEPCLGTGDCQHGTHVAGIAVGNNRSPNGTEPLRGVAPQADLLAINVFTVFCASSSCAGAYDSDIVKGLEFVLTRRDAFPGKRIASVNMSLGNSVSHATECNATSPYTLIINKLRKQNIATVISSGNNGFTNGVSSPACVSTALTVGASDKTDLIASFSNMGDLVDVMAPGVSIQSSVLVASGYAFFNGTSMGAPHVAGEIAALRTLFPDAPPAELERALARGPLIEDTRSGGTFDRRRIDAVRAYNDLSIPAASGSSGPTVISVRPAQ